MAIKTNENFIPFFLQQRDFQKASRDGLGYPFWIDTRLLSVKVKCPDPGVASHDQKPDSGIVSGIKSPPLARTPPTPDGIYIDRCITWTLYRAATPGQSPYPYMVVTVWRHNMNACFRKSSSYLHHPPSLFALLLPPWTKGPKCPEWSMKKTLKKPRWRNAASMCQRLCLPSSNASSTILFFMELCI